MAHLLERMNRGGEAEAVFRDLVDRRPDNPRHAGCLGILLKKSGRAVEAEAVFQRAVAAYRAAIRLKPDDPDAHYNLGSILAAQGKPDEATAEYRESIRFRPYYASGPNDDSRTQSQRREYDAHADRADCLRMQGRLEEAAAEFREAIRLKPDDAELHFNLGGCLTFSGKHEEGRSEIVEAFRLQPKPAEAVACTYIGLDFAGKGRWEDAVNQHRRAIRINSDFAQGHYNLGQALSRQGKHQEAVAEYRETLRRRPGHAHAHCHLGDSLWAVGERSEALAELAEAARLQPDWAEARSRLGDALLELGKREEALLEFREAARLDASRGLLNDAVAQFGRLLKELGRPEETIAIYRLLLRKSPARTDVRLLLCVALSDEGRHEDAVAELGKANPSATQDAELSLKFGDLLYARGKYARAADVYRRALTIEPGNNDLWRIVAVVYLLDGDTEGYRRHCRRMLDRFGATALPEIGERTARACLLRPTSAEIADEGRRLAERGVSLITPPMEWLRGWSEVARAMADLRTGHFADAVARTESMLSWLDETSSKCCMTLTLTARSIALSRLGRPDEAREAFDRGTTYFQKIPISTQIRAPAMEWHDRHCCAILRQEAEGLLLDRAFPADPFAP